MMVTDVCLTSERSSCEKYVSKQFRLCRFLSSEHLYKLLRLKGTQNICCIFTTCVRNTVHSNKQLNMWAHNKLSAFLDRYQPFHKKKLTRQIPNSIQIRSKVLELYSDRQTNLTNLIGAFWNFSLWLHLFGLQGRQRPPTNYSSQRKRLQRPSTLGVTLSSLVKITIRSTKLTYARLQFKIKLESLLC
jgi:hypothetical protein